MQRVILAADGRAREGWVELPPCVAASARPPAEGGMVWRVRLAP